MSDSIADRLAARGATPGAVNAELPDATPTADHLNGHHNDGQPPYTKDPAIVERQRRTGEIIASVFFQLSAVATVGFVVCFFQIDINSHYYSPMLGVTMGLSLLFIGIGAVVWAKMVIQDPEAVQERHEFADPREQEALGRDFSAGAEASQITKRPLLRRSFLGSQLLLGALAIVPLRSLGPQPKKSLEHTHWHKGVRLVDEFGKPLKVGDLAVGGLITVFPATAPDGSPGWVGQAAADSVTLFIRLHPEELKDYRTTITRSYEGHVAYSKLCTHLGCPVSLYEQQTHKLLCPCHQSQFLVTEAARPIFGPTTRDLPQLPLSVDDEGYFIALSDYTEPVGPGYWERD